jgi:hypothetical protein
MSSGKARSGISTVVAVAIVAYAVCDLVHEALGHGVACLFVSSVKPVSISTVALQTQGISRVVAASGSVANIVVGLVALAVLRFARRFTAGIYFVWLLAVTNLMNGTGYLFLSGLTNSGDWAVVIRDWSPAWAWRIALVVLGAFGYAAVVMIAASSLATFVRQGYLDRHEPPRLAWGAYLAGGVLLVVASALNRISSALILTSGASVGFGAMIGLLFATASTISAAQWRWAGRWDLGCSAFRRDPRSGHFPSLARGRRRLTFRCSRRAAVWRPGAEAASRFASFRGSHMLKPGGAGRQSGRSARQLSLIAVIARSCKLHA